MSKTLKLNVRDLALKVKEHVQKGLNASNFALKWEGPHIIREAYNSGCYLVSRFNSEDNMASINANWLKLYYP